MGQRDRSTTGYTMVKILLVIAIVGVIADLAFPALQQFIHRSKIEGVGAVFQTDGSIRWVWLRTWHGANWLAKGEGGKTCEWL